MIRSLQTQTDEQFAILLRHRFRAEVGPGNGSATIVSGKIKDMQFSFEQGFSLVALA